MSTDERPSLESPLLLGKRADALSLLIEQQIEPIFEQQGIRVPVRSCSLLLVLDQRGSASAADLAKTLGQSHQLVLQRIPVLIERGLIERRDDPNDRRRRLFNLTSEGVQQIERLAASSATIQEVYQELDREIGVDLFAALGRALDALRAESLESRFDRTVQSSDTDS